MRRFFYYIILYFCIFLLFPVQVLAQGNLVTKKRVDFYSFKKYFQFDPEVLKLALDTYFCGVTKGYDQRRGILTIVDYRLPSTTKRLWVLDLKHKKLLYHTYVAHGAGSGALYAEHFSNVVNSFASSIGLYKTGRSYDGAYGYSMRLYGLDDGFNNNAYKRHIVMHGAKYVSVRSIKFHGMMGMSHGCFALPKPLDHKVINTVANGTLLFAYYPSMKYLDDSKFLHCSIANA